jgi:hypothetical protein
MTRRSAPSPHSFTASERALIRHEMGQHFGQFPRLADGIMLRRWRTGARKGEPKIPPAVAGMRARGLVEIHDQPRWPVALFTAAGLIELRALLRDPRLMDTVRFAHLREELGLEPAPLAAE